MGMLRMWVFCLMVARMLLVLCFVFLAFSMVSFVFYILMMELSVNLARGVH